MILYCTTARPRITERNLVLPCPERVCRQAGKTYPHLCFATEPLAGMGAYVFSLDVPQAEVEAYEYPNDFRAESQARFFALPHDFILQHQEKLVRQTYEEITGTPWNAWVIPVLDKKYNRAARLLGAWALIWISRDTVASAKVHKKVGDEFLSLDVTLTSEFDPERDYVVIEYHEESEKEHGVKETWGLETVAGITPQWVIFPKAWEQWVWNRDVNDSAVRFILRHVPGARESVEFATSRESKHNRASAWREAADTIGYLLGREQHRRVDLGKLAGHSWTAVEAMPKRIAKRLGTHVREMWIPPLPEPEFEHPNESGRVLLANLYGAYPKRGPGVDHDPQDRPYQKLEGELDDGPFAGSRKVSAPLSAQSRVAVV